jgi:hypothetical protein
MAVKKFRKKPVSIEAVQWDGSQESTDYILTWVRGSGHAAYRGVSGIDATLHISTLEGDMKANAYDWIIKGVAGEFYPCRPDIFAATYEEIIIDEG